MFKMGVAVVSAEYSFWDNILRAAGTVPKDTRTIRGASGQRHDVVALGVDDKQHRLVLVTDAPDARSALLTQYDIQYAVKKFHVVTIRPMTVNVRRAVKGLMRLLGGLAQEDLDSQNSDVISAALKDLALGEVRTFFTKLDMSLLRQVQQLIQQLTLIDTRPSDRNPDKIALDYDRLIETDLTEQDRQVGICPLPLYEIKADDVEAIASGKLDDVVSRLKDLDIYQFFYPAADNLALGVVERGVSDAKSVERQISTTAQLGHPLGANELIAHDVAVQEMIDCLRDEGFLVEGELGIVVSPAGTEIRKSVRFKPKEGVVSKLLNRVNVNIDLKNIFGIGK